VRRLGYLALLLGFAQIVFGAVVRITGSGLGCGNHWPDCYGSFTPGRDSPNLLVEISHRYGAAALSLALAAPAPAGASERHPSLAELEGEVMCPTCHTTLDESNSAIAQQIKAFIRVRIAQGKTKSQIESQLVDNFGPSILAAPPKRGWDLLAWVLPLGGLGLGAIVLGILAWRWTRDRDRPAPGGGAKLDPDVERRLDAELARFDG